MKTGTGVFKGNFKSSLSKQTKTHSVFHPGQLHTHPFPPCAERGFNHVVMALSSTAQYIKVCLCAQSK